MLAMLRYQCAWSAKLKLVGGDKARLGWNELRKKDVCCMIDLEDAEQRKKRKFRAAKQPTQAHTNEDDDDESDDAVEDKGFFRMEGNLRWLNSEELMQKVHLHMPGSRSTSIGPYEDVLNRIGRGMRMGRL